MVLTPILVESIFTDCLFKAGEDQSDYVAAEGIIVKVGFHPERLASHKSEIAELLDELPDEFKESGGGGMSFLQACYTKHGDQWTGLHMIMEQLFLLGIGTGKAECLLPKEMWNVLPGGMPYYVIH